MFFAKSDDSWPLDFELNAFIFFLECLNLISGLLLASALMPNLQRNFSWQLRGSKWFWHILALCVSSRHFSLYWWHHRNVSVFAEYMQGEISRVRKKWGKKNVSISFSTTGHILRWATTIFTNFLDFFFYLRWVAFSRFLEDWCLLSFFLSYHKDTIKVANLALRKIVVFRSFSTPLFFETNSSPHIYFTIHGDLGLVSVYRQSSSIIDTYHHS